MAWRYLALNPITNAFIHNELPFRRDALRWDLSAAGQMTGTISPVRSDLLDAKGEPLLGEWKTALFAEQDGEIKWGGLINKADFDGPEWRIECIGYNGYSAGIPYTGAVYSKIQIDPTLVFLNIWQHIQGQTRGNLGLSVVRPTNCPVRLGLPAVKASGAIPAEEAQPYMLNWWEARDLGSELATLAAETPFDFTESHAWTPGGTISHTLTIGYPRVGRKRTDLAFVEGDNITKVVVVSRDGQEYTNHPIVLGKGEGAATIRGEAPVDDGRLRRPLVYTDKSAGTTARARTIADQQRAGRDLEPAVSSVEITEHPNAPISAIGVGDDILIDANVAWLGRRQMWHRVTSKSLINDTRATLTVALSDTFTYGAG